MGFYDDDYLIRLAAEMTIKKELLYGEGTMITYNLAKSMKVTVCFDDPENEVVSMYFNLAKSIMLFLHKETQPYIDHFLERTSLVRMRIYTAFSSVLERLTGDIVQYKNFPPEDFTTRLGLDPAYTDSEPLNLFWSALHPHIIDRTNHVKFNRFETILQETWSQNCVGYRLFKPMIEKAAIALLNRFDKNNEPLQKIVRFGWYNYAAMLLLTIDPNDSLIGQMAGKADAIVYYDYLRVVSGIFPNHIKTYEDTVKYHPLSHGVALRGTQPSVLNLLRTQFETKNIALLCADPGFGKTTLSLILSHMMISPRTTQRVLVVMKTSELVPQWLAQFKNLGLHHYYDYFVWIKSGDLPICSAVSFDGWKSKRDTAPLHEAERKSQFFFVFENRLPDMPPMDLDLMIYDECHQSITTTTGGALAHMRTRNLLLVSATPGETITGLLQKFSPDYQNLTLKYRPFVLEKFDSLFSLSKYNRSISLFSFNLQFIENNIYYNYALAERIREYVVSYKGVPKVIVFVNSIIHAYLLEWCLVQKGVSTTLYIQSDTQCDGNATVMIGTKNKISTGFDQNNSAVTFNHKFNTAVIATVVSKFDLFYQMLGRIMRNDIPSEELRLIYAFHTMSELSYENILKTSTIPLKIQTTVSRYGPMIMNLDRSYGNLKLTHGLLPMINRRVDEESIKIWRSSKPCRIETFVAEKEFLIQAFDNPPKLPIDIELFGSCNCRDFFYTTKINDDDDGLYVTCQHHCLSYLRSIFCYAFSCKRNMTKSETVPSFGYTDMLEILSFEKLSRKHKQVDSRATVRSHFVNANVNYMVPGTDKIGFDVISAVTTDRRHAPPLRKTNPVVPRNHNTRLEDLGSIPLRNLAAISAGKPVVFEP